MAPDEVESLPIQSFDVQVDVADDGVLLVRGTEAFELDVVGATIWQCCDGEKSIAMIAKAVTSEFDVDEATAMDDVSRLVADLRAAGLVD